jgi:Tfp pilus assembly protein FimT
VPPGGRRPAGGLRSAARGFTLLEALFVLVVTTVLMAAAIPLTMRGLDRKRAIAAARYLAQQCAMARFHAVGSGRHVALQFMPSGDDYIAQLYVDGNRNGLRAAEMADGIDAPHGNGVVLSAHFTGVRVGVDPALGLGDDPIRLSGSTLLSFSPTGTATAGSVYVLGRDGTQLAVRVLGVTGRTRVLRYEPSTGIWDQP